MKNIYIFILILISIKYSYSQEYKRNYYGIKLSGDTVLENSSIKQTLNLIQLKDLRFSTDYINLRIWKGKYQIIEISKIHKSSNPEISVYCLYYLYNKKNKIFEPQYYKVEIDSITSDSVFNKIFRYDFYNMLYKDKNNYCCSYKNLLMKYNFEYSDSAIYKTFCYDKTIQQSDTILEQIIKKINYGLNLQGIQSDFQYQLEDLDYLYKIEYGSYSMERTTRKNFFLNLKRNH
jgi:hypothetical protein